MEFKCINWDKRKRKAAFKEKIRLQAKKTKWFAWFPVRLDSAPYNCIWLEYIWRYGTISERWSEFSFKHELYGYECEPYISEWQYYKYEYEDRRNEQPV